MRYREIIADCSEIHTKHINALCGQNVEFLNVKAGGPKLSLRLSKVNRPWIWGQFADQKRVYPLKCQYALEGFNVHARLSVEISW